MKAPKDRKLNDYLKSNIKKQEERIKMWGWIARQSYVQPFDREEGTYYSTRFK